MRISSYENGVTAGEKQEDYKTIFLTTFHYLWPNELVLRTRIITALFCLLLAKLFTVLNALSLCNIFIVMPSYRVH